MPFGNVYIFNLYAAPASMDVNQQGGRISIAPPSPSSTPQYAPQQAVVPRSNLTQDQLSGEVVFCVGDNDVSINYGGQNWRATVTVPRPPAPPLESDLWLYLAYQQAFLFTADGALIGTFPMQQA